MIAKRLNGRAAADRLLAQLHRQLRRRRKSVRLATILVGERYDSALYVRLKVAAAQRVGLTTERHDLPHTTSTRRLEQLIQRLNRRSSVHGILLQLPLPPHLDADRAILAIHLDKDVDGFRPQNTLIVPPPVAAVLKLIQLGHPPRRCHVTILGKTTVYTRQLEDVFRRRGWTTMIASKNWMSSTKKSDVIVTVLGRGPKLLGRQVKPGAIVVDVGIRHEHGKTVGDVDASVWSVAKAVSPVPGGVGPLTVAYVLINCYKLATLNA